jgi:hypothetical protein
MLTGSSALSILDNSFRSGGGRSERPDCCDEREDGVGDCLFAGVDSSLRDRSRRADGLDNLSDTLMAGGLESSGSGLAAQRK